MLDISGASSDKGLHVFQSKRGQRAQQMDTGGSFMTCVTTHWARAPLNRDWRVASLRGTGCIHSCALSPPPVQVPDSKSLKWFVFGGRGVASTAAPLQYRQ